MRDILPEDPAKIDPARWKRMNMSVEAYREMRVAALARDALAPEMCAMAPDFEIERLSPAGARTGEMFRLSDTRGKPVALMKNSKCVAYLVPAENVQTEDPVYLTREEVIASMHKRKHVNQTVLDYLKDK